MKLLKILTIFGLTTPIALFATTGIAQAETILNYEFPLADAVYLNICSMKYTLNSGMCSKVNIKNTRMNSRIGTITIDNNTLGDGAEAWAVFVHDDNDGSYRYLYHKKIIGGGVYNFGPGYSDRVPKGPY